MIRPLSALHNQPSHQFGQVRVSDERLVRRARDGDVGQAYVVIYLFYLLQLTQTADHISGSRFQAP